MNKIELDESSWLIKIYAFSMLWGKSEGYKVYYAVNRWTTCDIPWIILGVIFRISMGILLIGLGISSFGVAVWGWLKLIFFGVYLSEGPQTLLMWLYLIGFLALGLASAIYKASRSNWRLPPPSESFLRKIHVMQEVYSSIKNKYCVPISYKSENR